METIKVKTIIEIVGTPKEHVEETINKVVTLINENKKFDLISQDVAEIKEVDLVTDVKNVWSSFGEFEIEFKNILDLTDFCFEFMPSSVEIIEPEIVKTDGKDLGQSLNDFLAKLHQYDMTLKKIILQQRANLKKQNEK
ncbi:MAG: hypothetical protein ABIH25_02055 [Candidatus Woesearchaeota archaeon]